MEAVEFLNRNLDKDIQAVLNTLVNQAYRMNREICDTYFHGNKLKKQLSSSIINGLVSGILLNASETGRIPFRYIEKPNTNGSHYYLKLCDDDKLVLTISQAKSRDTLPRKSKFRSFHSMYNQLCLPLPEFNYISTDPVYAILTHGYKTPTPSFVVIGIPEPNYRRWSGYIDITDASIRDIQEIVPVKETVQLKASVIERLRTYEQVE